MSIAVLNTIKAYWTVPILRPNQSHDWTPCQFVLLPLLSDMQIMVVIAVAGLSREVMSMPAAVRFADAQGAHLSR